MPRAPKITPAVAIKIFESLAGGESLDVAAGKVGIDEKTIRRRVAADPEFRQAYREARAFWAEHVADETMALADGAVAEAIAAPEGTANAVVQALKLKIETRKWLLSRLAPHLLGDRIEVAGDPDAPLIPAEAVDTGKLALALCGLLAEAKKNEPLPPVTIDAVPEAVEEAALPAPAPPQAEHPTILSGSTAETGRVVPIRRELPSNYYRGRT